MATENTNNVISWLTLSTSNPVLSKAIAEIVTRNPSGAKYSEYLKTVIDSLDAIAANDPDGWGKVKELHVDLAASGSGSTTFEKATLKNNVSLDDILTFARTIQVSLEKFAKAWEIVAKVENQSVVSGSWYANLAPDVSGQPTSAKK